jgi:hypothetical protein
LLFSVFLFMFFFFKLSIHILNFKHDSSLNFNHNSNVDKNPIFLFIIIVVSIIFIYLPVHHLIPKEFNDYHNYLSQTLSYIYIIYKLRSNLNYIVNKRNHSKLLSRNQPHLIYLLDT